MLSFDRYSRDDVIGEVMLEMENLNLKDSEVTPLSLIRDIAPRSMKVNIEVLIVFHLTWYLPAEGPGKGRDLGLSLPPASGRQTHGGRPEGPEPP